MCYYVGRLAHIACLLSLISIATNTGWSQSCVTVEVRWFREASPVQRSSVTAGAQFAANWAKNKTPGAQMWNFTKKKINKKSRTE